MLQKFKNWLIKKLGGYTKAEYDMIPIQRMVFQPEDLNVIALRAECTYDELRMPPQEWVENRLIENLAQQMKPYVTWEFCQNPMDMTRRGIAKVRVVKGR